MIISHRHRFIFIKTRKTAGTSIEVALAAICGPDDVITMGEPAAYTGVARNYEGGFNPLREILLQPKPLDVLRALRDWRSRPKFYNHIGAPSVMARVPAEVWRGYYKFCFERNPWDKSISFFHFLNRRRTLFPDFDRYVLEKPRRATLDQHYCVDWGRYTRRDRMVVDRVFDFADVRGGVEQALTEAGVARALIEGLELPRLKGGIRKAGTVMSPAARDRIGEIFAREIAAFGYAPPAELVAAG